MTGWRLGFGVMPPPLVTKMATLLTHSVGCTATFTQYAGLEAIEGPQDDVHRLREQFRHRRDVIVSRLNAMPGVHCHTPKGAFYVFPNVSSFGRPVDELASLLLEEAGVALLPGTSFGANGDGHLRLSYANSLENIEKALDRIERTLASL
jgi:aspartate/methionine/tyrosine aminotransferase